METRRPEPGEVLAGKLRVERLLGEGGMGYVLEATHLHLDRRVAVKMLQPEIASNSTAVARFLREARAAARISSEHVVRVLDASALDDGRPILVMEYLDGQNLSQLVRTSGPLPPEVAADYVLQAGEALAEAHADGMVHRDLKPENLFLTRRADGSPLIKVLDFGISKLRPREGTSGDARTRTAALMGSPLYMSPEQLESARDVDARCDLWALGVVLFELMSGRVPFDGDTLPQVIAGVMNRPPPPLRSVRPDVPAELEAVVARCLEKQPTSRFQNIAELARALAPVASAQGQASIQTIERVLGVAAAGGSRPPNAVVAGGPGGSVRPAAGAATNATFGGTLGVPKRRTGQWVVIGSAVAVVAVAGVAGWMALHRPGANGGATTAPPPPSSVAAASTTEPPVASLPPIAATPELSAVPSAPSALVRPTIVGAGPGTGHIPSARPAASTPKDKFGGGLN